MTILMVPTDPEPWPTLGPEVCAWIEEFLVFGPGDLRGEPAVLDEEKRALIYRLYEVFPQGHPNAGRRRFKRACVSLSKGQAKTELAAWVAAAELDYDSPVRCIGWRDGKPVGGPVTDPYIPLVAYTEEQSDELAYGALYSILSECPLADHFDIGLERIVRIGGDGKAVSLSSSPSARDGARTTFQVADETHWWTSDKLRLAHQTMLNNIPKRLAADAWALEVTTAYEPGANSVAESTHEFARQVDEGRASDARLFYFHRQAGDGHDLKTTEGMRDAVIEASGITARYRDIDAIVELGNDPTTDKKFWERVWLNRPTQSTRKAFDIAQFRDLAANLTIREGSMITVGFDGAQFHDATGIVCTDIRTGHQWVAGIWEQPGGAEGQNWQVPDTEVDAVMEALFERFNVWRLYADPPYWQSWISKWSGRWGDERVIEWWTNRYRQMAMALQLYQEAIDDAMLSHDGSDALLRHVGNAHKQELPQRDVDDAKPLWLIRKEKSDSPFKIDLAMAAVLSWEARNDAIALGITGEIETVFSESNLAYWQEKPTGGNRYIIVSPPHEKRPDPTMTNISVVELRPDRTYTVLALIRGRMTLLERTDMVFQLHRDYDPLRVGYEKRGLEGDRQHVKERQNRENYRFVLTPLDTPLSENERIMRLVPVVEREQLVLPERYYHDGVDQVAAFRSQELGPYPYGVHADMLDNLSSIFDMPTSFPAPDVAKPPTIFPSDF